MTRRVTAPQQSEASFQRAVIECANLHGWRVYHAHDSRRQVRPGVLVGDTTAAGFPDLVLCRPPQLVFAELKTETGRVSPRQKEWIGLLDGCAGSTVSVFIWRPGDWAAIERVLSNGSDRDWRTAA